MAIRRSPTFWWLSATYTVLVVAALSLVSAVATAAVERFELSQTEQDLHAKAFLITRYVHDAPPNRVVDFPFDEEALDARVTLLDARGKVLVDSVGNPSLMDNHADRPEIVAARKGQAKAVVHRSNTTGATMLYYAQRVDGDASPVTFVRVASSLDHLHEQVLGLQRSIWGSAAGTAIAAICLGLVFARGIAVPVQHLTETAARVSNREATSTLHPVRHRDLGDLRRSLDVIHDELAADGKVIEAKEEQLQAILDRIDEGVLAIDGEQRLLFANRRAGVLLQFVNPATRGSKLVDVVENPAAADGLLQFLKPSESSTFPARYECSPRCFDVSVTSLGRTSGALFVLTTVSSVPRLFRTMAQEIRARLSVIKACVETLIDGAMNDMANRGYFLAQVNAKADQVARLMTDVFRLVELQSGHADLQYETIAIAPLVAACIERHKVGAGRGRVGLEQFESAMPGENSEATADERALQEILDRLVDNALNNTPPGGRVQIGWKRRSNEVLLQVQDSGTGISADTLPRVFDPFFVVNPARTRELGGAGLGLSIVKQLALRMHGTVHVASTLGRGTTVTVSLRGRFYS